MKKGTRICFIGDSFVNGTGDEHALGWVGRLCALSAQRGVDLTYYNLGIRGNTSRNVLARIDNEVTPRMGKAEDERVVLSFGVNDTLLEDQHEDKSAHSSSRVRVSEQESIENMEKIIKFVQAKYALLIVGLLPVDRDEQNVRIQSVNTAYNLIADQAKVPFIDVFDQLVNDQDYRKEIRSTDGAHPTSKGYETITQTILSSGKWWL